MDNIKKLKEAIVSNLEDSKEIFRETKEKYEGMIDEEVSILKELIDNLYEVYHHYYKNDFYFVEISDTIRSTLGPILSFNNSTRELIVYNVEKRIIQVDKIGYDFKKTGETEYINYKQLINKSEFNEIINNLILNATLYKHYIKKQQEGMAKMEDEINQFEKKYQ